VTRGFDWQSNPCGDVAERINTKQRKYVWCDTVYRTNPQNSTVKNNLCNADGRNYSTARKNALSAATSSCASLCPGADFPSNASSEKANFHLTAETPFFLASNPATGFFNSLHTKSQFLAMKTTAFLLVALIGMATAQSTVSSTDRYSFAANAGWIDIRADATNGTRVLDTCLSGYAYAGNFGWIHLGNASPANGHT
jgi:hypothetical protein